MARLIDADAVLAKIDERIRLAELDTATKYGNETPEQADNSYQTWMKYEIADFVDDIRDEIVNAPTIIERHKGKWIESIDHRYHVCTECKMEILKDGAYDSFCPNCGAMMEKEDPEA